MTAGDKLSFLAEEGRVVDGEEHRHRRFVDSDRRQWVGLLEVADGIADLKLLQSYDGTDITTPHFRGLDMSHTFEGVQLLDTGLLHRSVTMRDGHVHSLLEHATVHTAHGDASRIAGIV